MSRYRQTIDDLRAFLQGDDQRLTDRVARLAEEYAAGCREANDRLRRCMERLGQGLRAEAVQLAEAEPPVTELVTELDLAELQPAWDEICMAYDLPKAEPLRLELAEAINEAYAELEPLNALLSRHRRLALARAPLPWRIDVLRQLAVADSQTTFWEDDLRAYERARLREVEQESREAAKAGDTGRLQAIIEELTGSDWRERPGADLLRRVRSLGGQVTRQTARQELEAFEPALHAVFAALDLPAARLMRDRWLEAAGRAKLADGDPLAERVAPILGWIADEDAREAREREFRQAVGELEAAVENDAVGLTELDRRAHATARFDLEIPAALAAAYRTRRASLEAGERRRRVLIGVAAATALLVVAGFVGMVLWRSGVAVQARQLAGEVTRLTDDGKLVEARRLFNEHRDISTGEEWLAARRALEEAERADAQRRSAYVAAVEAVKGAADAAAAEAHLKEAREAARSPDEKLEVARLERSWQERRDAAFDESERRFRAATAAAAEVLVRLDDAVAKAELPVLEPLLAEAETAVRSLGPLASEVRPAVAAERGVLDARLAALRTAIGEKRDRERAFAEITRSLEAGGDPTAPVDKYVAALEAYRKRFPKDPRSTEFGDVLAEADVWRAAVAWRAATFGWRELRPQSADTTSQRLAAVEQFLAVHAAAPDAPVARRIAALLRSLAAREGAEGLNARLLALFRAPLVGGPLYVLKTRDGRSYYLTMPKDFSGTFAASFSYVIGTDVRRETKSKLVQKDELVGLSTMPAAQVALAETVRAELPRTTIAGWDAYVIGLAKQIHSADAIDPFLRHLLLSEVLAAASEGSDSLAPALADVRSRLEDKDVDPAARWMDPENADAAASRQRAAAALRRSSGQELDAALKVSETAEAGLARELAVSRRLIGWLRRDGSDWECVGQTKETATVAVAVPGGAGDSASWQPIGTCGPAGSELRGTGLKQGRLVFTVEPAAGR